jgi:hypothetical protein
MSDNKKTDVVAMAKDLLNLVGTLWDENAALLKRCEDAEAAVGKLTLEIIDLKQGLSQKGQSDDN